MKLVTSNLNKLAEFKRFGLDLEIATGLDLREVKGDSEQVAIYKAIEAGENLLVEDTILTIDGEEIVDIRTRLDELPRWENKEAVWQVSIACLQGGVVSLSVGKLVGQIKAPMKDYAQGFGFDPYFYPDGGIDSLAKLEANNQKDNCSSRREAIMNFLQGENIKKFRLEDMPTWTGEYQ